MSEILTSPLGTREDAPTGITGLTAQIVDLLERRGVMEDDRGADVLIQCGYMDGVHPLHDLAPFTTFTVQAGLDLGQAIKRRWKRSRVEFCTLVNDIGQVCGPQACSVDQRPGQAALAIARGHVTEQFVQAGVPAERHHFYTENTLKNRGVRFLKRQLHRSHPRLEQREDTGGTEVLLRVPPAQQIHLANRREGQLTGKCPVIMGAFYHDALQFLEGRYPGDGRARLIVDLCDLIDRDKVLRGLEVVRQLPEFRVSNGSGAAVGQYLLPVFIDPLTGQGFPHLTRL